MELEILKKKINTYRTNTGKITNLPDELAVEILLAWEQWTGPGAGFFSAIGADHRKMAKILGKAKKLKREGRVPISEFKEITDAVLGGGTVNVSSYNGQGIELSWDQGKVIRFPQVETLIDFLKKVA
jgi:hypothetical protein